MLGLSSFGYVKTGSGLAKVEGQGTIQLRIALADGTTSDIRFTEVLYCPSLCVSVISPGQLRPKGLYYHGLYQKILRIEDNVEIAYVPEIDGTPTFLECTDEVQAAFLIAYVAAFSPRDSQLAREREITLQEAHEIWGHTNLDDVKQLLNTVDGLKLKNTKKFDCETCYKAKGHQQISRTPQRRAQQAFDVVHLDVVGHILPPGPDGEQYWLLLTDDFTRYRWIFFVKSRAEITQVLLDFDRMVTTQYDKIVKVYRLDNDKCFINQVTIKHFRKRGTQLQPSTLYTAHQNGVAEASNKLTTNKVRCILIGAPHLPPTFWPHAAKYAVQLLNVSLTTALADSKTPSHAFNEFLGCQNPVLNLYNLRR